MARALCWPTCLHGEFVALDLTAENFVPRVRALMPSVSLNASLRRPRISTVFSGQSSSRRSSGKGFILAEVAAAGGKADSGTGLLDHDNAITADQSLPLPSSGISHTDMVEKGMKSPAVSSGIEVDSVSEVELKENGFRSTRRTKLVCTIGPASCTFEQLEALASGGMNVARLNMCHGTRDWHRAVIRNVRMLNAEKGYSVAIMMDTEGSEIHMGDLGEKSAKAEILGTIIFLALDWSWIRVYLSASPPMLQSRP